MSVEQRLIHGSMDQRVEHHLFAQKVERAESILPLEQVAKHRKVSARFATPVEMVVLVLEVHLGPEEVVEPLGRMETEETVLMPEHRVNRVAAVGEQMVGVLLLRERVKVGTIDSVLGAEEQALVQPLPAPIHFLVALAARVPSFARRLEATVVPPQRAVSVDWQVVVSGH